MSNSDPHGLRRAMIFMLLPAFLALVFMLVVWYQLYISFLIPVVGIDYANLILGGIILYLLYLHFVGGRR